MMVNDPLEQLNVSRETIDRLRAFEGEVNRWNKTINLVAQGSLRDFWTRHVCDSAQLAQISEPHENWVDMGSGGGLPAVVLAIIFKETRPETTITMIESDARKCAFLLSISQKLGLNTKVIKSRIEDQPNMGAGAVSARALTSLSGLCRYAHMHLGQGGKCYFLKGKKHREELALAQDSWGFEYKIWPSQTDKQAATIELWGLVPREK